MGLQTIIITFAALLPALTFGAHWTYSEPTKWDELCLKGNRQSPIDIVSRSVSYDDELAKNPIKYSGFTGKYAVNMTNNGHTVAIRLEQPSGTENRPRLYAGGLPGISKDGYVLGQVHFHWGSSVASNGAEHLIDGQRAPVEVHLVHFNRKYETFRKALNETDGLAVIGFFLDPSLQSRTTENSANYSQFIELLSGVVQQGIITEAEIDLEQLVPKWAIDGHSNRFFRYNGSLTTPPCSESVTWTVYEDKIPIDPKLVEQLLKLKITGHGNNHHDEVLKNNYRQVQPLGKRVVKTNKPTTINGEVPMAVTGGSNKTSTQTPTSGAPRDRPLSIAKASILAGVVVLYCLAH